MLSISRRNSFDASAGVLDCVRHAGRKIRLAGDRNEVDIGINDLLDDVDQSIAKALAGKNLQEMILKLTRPELTEYSAIPLSGCGTSL